MKRITYIVSILLGLFIVCSSAQQIKDKHMIKILWVVDGVALNDSVFGYTLDQMRSDSASVLVSRGLSGLYQEDIENITVIDSIEASEYGFINCNGVVKIETSYRQPFLAIINGLIFKSKNTVTAGELLGGYDYLRHIITQEFTDIEEYGIND
ncbi:MAG: hypothetical protein K2G69_09005, partial [Muribaculaceae bacterium]|nr:hypothetical protein [Muribaculaceae bacterium]